MLRGLLRDLNGYWKWFKICWLLLHVGKRSAKNLCRVAQERKRIAMQMSVLCRILEALFKCQSETSWGKKWKWKLIEFSADVSHLRNEFWICAQIFTVTGSFLSLSPTKEEHQTDEWPVGWLAVCESSNLWSFPEHVKLRVIKAINGLGGPLHSFITKYWSDLWVVSFAKISAALTSCTHYSLFFTSEYKWVFFYLSKESAMSLLM